MADTPAPAKPKRVTKAAAGEAKPKAPRRAVASKAAPATAEAKKPAAKPRAPKPAGAAKPRAPRKPATPKPVVAATPSPSPAPAAKPAPRNAAPPENAPRVGLLAALGTLAAVGGAFYVWRSARAEEPDYKAVETDGVIEVRDYPALVTAATEVRGQRQRALNTGFRRLADYLFAKSRPGSKLAMTAPVLSDGDATGGWRTRFIMPTGIARANLPAAPDGVVIESESARRVAALRFSGRADDATLAAKEGALRSWLQLKNLPSEGKAIHAFYNAPFLPGPLRRNEIMIVLSEKGG